MAKCKICEYCGACLDFGERCDCEECREPKGSAAWAPFGKLMVMSAGGNG